MPRALSLLLCALGAATLLACGTSSPPQTAAAAAASAVPTDPNVPGPGVGQPAPAISLKTIDGATLALTPGKVNLMVFWATWSEPDKQELIKIQEIAQRFGPAKLAVIAVSVDESPDLLPAFAKTYGLRFPIAWDAGRRLGQLYRPATDPATYVVDRAGVIRFLHSGYHDGEQAKIASEIESLLR